MTTSAPCARSAAACVRMVSTSGATDSPPTLLAIVAVKARSVITPTMPTLTPATSTSVVGRTLVHRGGAPLAVSIRFAARKGKRASAARARSAPRGSSVGARGVAGLPTGPKSNSWLPIAAAV